MRPPPPTPITTTRPHVAMCGNTLVRLGAPTSSSTTSYGAPAPSSPGASTTPAPSVATASRRSGSRTVAVTTAPACAASCTAAVPTPPAAPETRTRSPICSSAWRKSPS